MFGTWKDARERQGNEGRDGRFTAKGQGACQRLDQRSRDPFSALPKPILSTVLSSSCACQDDHFGLSRNGSAFSPRTLD